MATKVTDNTRQWLKDLDGVRLRHHLDIMHGLARASQNIYERAWKKYIRPKQAEFSQVYMPAGTPNTSGYWKKFADGRFVRRIRNVDPNKLTSRSGYLVSKLAEPMNWNQSRRFGASASGNSEKKRSKIIPDEKSDRVNYGLYIGLTSGGYDDPMRYRLIHEFGKSGITAYSRKGKMFKRSFVARPYLGPSVKDEQIDDDLKNNVSLLNRKVTV